MHISKPIQLEYLMESLIIAFGYRPEQRRFVIISTYPERSPGSKRDLVGLNFTGVKQFVRQPGDLARLRQFHFDYATKEDAGTREFQHIETRKQPGGSHYVRFWFGPNMGGLSFEYQDLEVHRRGSRSVQNRPGSRVLQDRRGIHIIRDEGEDVTRFDVNTNEVFDFYNPFPHLLDVTELHN